MQNRYIVKNMLSYLVIVVLLTTGRNYVLLVTLLKGTADLAFRGPAKDTNQIA